MCNSPVGSFGVAYEDRSVVFDSEKRMTWCDLFGEILRFGEGE